MAWRQVCISSLVQNFLRVLVFKFNIHSLLLPIPSAVNQALSPQMQAQASFTISVSRIGPHRTLVINTDYSTSWYRN